MGVHRKKQKLSKEYAAVGSVLLLILATLWGWYLKTNQVEVFKAGEVPKSVSVASVKNGSGNEGNKVSSTGDAQALQVRLLPAAESASGKQPRNEFSVKININTAGVDELMTLNGIGEVRAKAIVDYRETNGLFRTIEEILLVKGIGEATFEKIKNSITTGSDK